MAVLFLAVILPFYGKRMHSASVFAIVIALLGDATYEALWLRVPVVDAGFHLLCGTLFAVASFWTAVAFAGCRYHPYPMGN